MEKYIGFGFSFILLSLVLFPTISANLKTVSENMETIEISVELFELEKINYHNISVTIDAANELYSYLYNLEYKLENSTSKNETINIFKDVIVKLENYGLLNDFNVNEIEKFVFGKYLQIISPDLLKKLFDCNEVNYENSECLTCGLTSKTRSLGLFEDMLNFLLTLIVVSLVFFKGFELVIKFIVGLEPLISIIFNLIPLKIEGSIGIGEVYYDPNAEVITPGNPAEGWVFTNGTLGAKTCKEPKWGQLSKSNNDLIGGLNVYDHPKGIKGFTGLIIGLLGKKFYIGSALLVDVGSEFPF